MLAKLQQVANDEIDRLAFFLPPGSAKSTYGSIVFPAWFLQKVRASKIIAASHTTELAERFGRRVRNLVVEHGDLLDLRVSGDSSAAGRWSTDQDNEYYAAGVDTGIAGFRADLAIIDDPVRSRADADSQLLRDRHWDWYKSDLIPRMRPGGRIVLIMTRWHEDDLAARILAEPGTRWHVVSIPAEAEADDPLGRAPGEYLWDDDGYGYAEVMRTAKLTQPARNWSALYQQHPTPDEGNYFNRNWLKPYDRAPPPERMRTYGASDYAVTEDGGDYTVHIVIGLDPMGEMYLLDLWRKQSASDQWVEAFCDLVRKWKPLDWAEEQGQMKAGIGPFLDSRMRFRQAYVVRTAFPTRGDKATRARSIQGRMSLNRLHVPVSAPWYAEFEREILSFPAGKHDDQVDALGLIGQLLDKVVFGTPKPKPDSGVMTGYTAALPEYDNALDKAG
jgi:predicted phage terminase large subunit-like protein